MRASPDSAKPPAATPPAAPLPKTRILAAARKHFLAHGFRGVTMDDLAAELAISKKTLYAQFASKGALLTAVLEDKLSEADADLGRIASQSSVDFPAALCELLACVRRHSEELQPAFLRDMDREAPELFGMVQTRRRAFIQHHFGRLLGEGRKAGLIRKDIPATLMIEILVGATDALINPQKLSEIGLPAKTGLSAIVRIFFEGVVTKPAGRKK